MTFLHLILLCFEGLLITIYRQREGLELFGNWKLLKKLLDPVVKVKSKIFCVCPSVFVSYTFIPQKFFKKKQTKKYKPQPNKTR